MRTQASTARKPARMERRRAQYFPPHAGTILPAAGGDQKAVAERRPQTTPAITMAKQ